MKYKIIALVNFLLGGLHIFTSLGLMFSVIPRLTELYDQVEVEISISGVYFTSSVNLIFGSVLILLGYKLLTLKNKSINKYYTLSLILILAAIALTAITSYMQILMVTEPLYNLTGPLEN
jgi:hypothetical protein